MMMATTTTTTTTTTTMMRMMMLMIMMMMTSSRRDGFNVNAQEEDISKAITSGAICCVVDMDCVLYEVISNEPLLLHSFVLSGLPDDVQISIQQFLGHRVRFGENLNVREHGNLHICITMRLVFLKPIRVLFTKVNAVTLVKATSTGLEASADAM